MRFRGSFAVTYSSMAVGDGDARQLVQAKRYDMSDQPNQTTKGNDTQAGECGELRDLDRRGAVC